MTITVASANIALTISRQDGTNAILTWSGGAAPFVVQMKTDLFDATWSDRLTTSDRTATVALEGFAGFLRIRD